MRCHFAKCSKLLTIIGFTLNYWSSYYTYRDLKLLGCSISQCSIFQTCMYDALSAIQWCKYSSGFLLQFYYIILPAAGWQKQSINYGWKSPKTISSRSWISLVLYNLHDYTAYIHLIKISSISIKSGWLQTWDYNLGFLSSLRTALQTSTLLTRVVMFKTLKRGLYNAI